MLLGFHLRMALNAYHLNSHKMKAFFLFFKNKLSVLVQKNQPTWRKQLKLLTMGHLQVEAKH